MAGEYQSKWTGAQIDDGIQAAYDAAPKENGVFYIEGSGSTAGTWLGSHDDISEYYDGLMIAYKVGIAGASTTTLNINNLGAVTVKRQASSAVTTHYPVDSVVFLVYSINSSGTAYWQTADYDANSYAYVRQYYTTTNANYPLLFKYDSGISSTTSYVTKYTRNSNNLYVNPSTGALYAKELYRDGLASTRVFGTLIPYGTSIPANADLNTTTYLKVGNYFCSSNANTATLTNCPTTSAFMMQVLSPLSTTVDNETTGTWVYRLRKIQVYTGAEYIQYCYAGATAGTWTYTAWKKIINTDDFDALVTRVEELEEALANKQDKIESWSDLKG